MNVNQGYDYKRFGLLYVDDERQTIENFKEYFSDTFEVTVAASAAEALDLFKKDPDYYAIVMTDQRMPSETGVQLLEKIKTLRPRTLRILATAYSDMQAAIDAVNTGAIYKYVTKPWDPPELEITLKRAMEFYLVQRERDLLMREKMSALQRLMMTDRLISLGIFAAGLNHHLRNSLTAVKTFLDLAPFKLQSENIDISHLRSPDYWNDFYHTVQQQMEKILLLLKDVQEIPDPPHLPLKESINISGLINEVLDSSEKILSERNIHIVRDIGGEYQIEGNSAVLRKAMVLLVEDEKINVTEGGELKVGIKDGQHADGRKGVHITVMDNGPGLSPENINCMFDPFFTRTNRPEQYGLNLLTCFFLIYHHSGSISVGQSDAGGARFEIFLPLEPQAKSFDKNEEFLSRVFAVERAWEKMLIEG